MFRMIANTVCRSARLAGIVENLTMKPCTSAIENVTNRSFSSIIQQTKVLFPLNSCLIGENKSLLNNPNIIQTHNNIINRTVTKFSLKTGKRKSVKTVLKRFYRLNWGIWIRTKAGRSRHLWKKSSRRKYRLRQHVFTNATQSHMLDKMVTSFWRKPKYFIDDPYEPYHTREEFYLTAKKPRPS